MTNIANILKNLRNQSNMSQEELAKLLGISRSAVSSYENGTRSPNNELLVKMANIFNVSTDYLLGLTISYNTDSEYDLIFSEIRSLLETSDLSDKQKNEILSEVKSYFKWRLDNTDL